MVALNVFVAGQCITPCIPEFNHQDLEILCKSRQLQASRRNGYN